MKDVARIAGVSLATVSRVLNDKGGTIPISRETRERVLAVVDKVGYKPNYAAQRLRSQELDHSIGVYIPWGWGLGGLASFTGKLLESASKSMRGLPYTLTLVFYELGNIRLHHEELQRVRAHRIDAMLIVGADHKDLDYLDSVADSGAPPVITVHRELARGNYVTARNRQGAHALVSHLCGEGHRRIAIISTPPVHGGRSDFVYTQRFDGYLDALRERQLERDDTLVRFVDEDEIHRVDPILRELSGLPAPPTALFAARDSLAVAAVRGLKRMGLHVPDDMAVVSFSDNGELSSIVEPSLTRAIVPVEQMGTIAATRLIEMIKSRHTLEPLQTALDCEIRYGESG